MKMNEYLELLRIKKRIEELREESDEIIRWCSKRVSQYLFASLVFGSLVIIFDMWIFIIPQLICLFLMFNVINESEKIYKRHKKEIKEIEQEFIAYGIVTEALDS